jgi:hypothetical protein
VSVQDWTQLISVLATVGALLFAWLTVQQARDLRREDRLARLGELVGDYAAVLLRLMQGASDERLTGLPVARARLEATLAVTDETLPACTALLAVEKTEGASTEQAIAATEAAAAELAALFTEKLRHPRG